MLPDWQRIRAARTDLTDWLLHWTRGQRIDGKHHNALQVLQMILQCGYLKPTYAPRAPYHDMTGRAETPRIRGKKPAVCFTNQTLRAFIQSYNTLGQYQPYALAFKKRDLYNYGARPVIYAGEDMLTRLEERDHYLWVHYKPDFDKNERPYPIDWTHECEWRTTVHPWYRGRAGERPLMEGVPLVLASSDAEGNSCLALPWLLVRTLNEARTLRAALNELPAYEGDNHLIQHLYAHVHEITIIPLDLVSERLRAGQRRWVKLETLPEEEVRAVV